MRRQQTLSKCIIVWIAIGKGSANMPIFLIVSNPALLLGSMVLARRSDSDVLLHGRIAEYSPRLGKIHKK